MNDKPTKRFVIYNLNEWTFQEFDLIEQVPNGDRWAFVHIVDCECGSIACGKTVYEVRNQS